MNSMTGIILPDDNDSKLGVLTEMRSTSAIPMASRYRLIDFVLSSMVNSGIRNVGIATQFNYSSLMDHLGSGKAWDLNRKDRGLYILPPNIGRETLGSVIGDVDVLYGIGTFLRKTKPDYFVVTKGNTFFNMNFKAALEYHVEKGADITIIYNDEKEDTDCLTRHTLVNVNDDGRIDDIMVNHPHPSTSFVSTDTMIIERTLLIGLIEDCVSRGEHDICMDILVKNLNRLKIFGYKFDGYVGRIDSLESYYKHNMNFLRSDVRNELFNSDAKIFTKVRNQIPTRYSDSCRVSNCLIADGCTIEGTVENSILFRGVRIGKDTTVKNSIIMQDSVIQSNCFVENVVLDKEVTLLEGKNLMGQPSYPFVVKKGTTI